MRIHLATSALALGLIGLAGAAAAQTTELRYTCYSDGNECEVMRDLLTRFTEANPDITVTVDEVPYQAILESLPVQLAAGEGPDLGRVTDLGGLSPYYLNLREHVDPAYWEENFGATLPWFRPPGDTDGIYGMMTQLTVTGAYVNRTLFEQAGVELPAEDAGWEEWAAACRQVADATQVPFPMAIDRSGHRLAGPAISMGAQIFADDGTPALVDDGFSDMVETFVTWNEDGTMAREVWAGRGGATYQDAAEEFINANLVYYYSGSWQVGAFATAIGDAFDWVVTGSPCGPGGCTGMPGGAGLVGFKDTAHPEAVAKVIDFFASEAIHRELIARTRSVPAHAGIAAAGVEYPDAAPQVQAALAAWTEQAQKITDIAYAYQGFRLNRAMFNATTTRVGQAVAGEISVDEALQRIEADIQDAVAADKQ